MTTYQKNGGVKAFLNLNVKGHVTMCVKEASIFSGNHLCVLIMAPNDKHDIGAHGVSMQYSSRLAGKWTGPVTGPVTGLVP
jgi:hypothetical protein